VEFMIFSIVNDLLTSFSG